MSAKKLLFEAFERTMHYLKYISREKENSLDDDDADWSDSTIL